MRTLSKIFKNNHSCYKEILSDRGILFVLTKATPLIDLNVIAYEAASMLQMIMAPVDAVPKKSRTAISKKNQAAAGLNSAKTKVFLSRNGKEFGVNIVLKGGYMGADVGVLRDFFNAVSYYPATAWTLHMEEVELISLRGILMVADFLRIIHQRGQAVKIAGIHENVYNTLRDLKLARAFDLADCSGIAWSH